MPALPIGRARERESCAKRSYSPSSATHTKTPPSFDSGVQVRRGRSLHSGEAHHAAKLIRLARRAALARLAWLIGETRVVLAIWMVAKDAAAAEREVRVRRVADRIFAHALIQRENSGGLTVLKLHRLEVRNDHARLA